MPDELLDVEAAMKRACVDEFLFPQRSGWERYDRFRRLDRIEGLVEAMKDLLDRAWV